jgi:hypothetical protein
MFPNVREFSCLRIWDWQSLKYLKIGLVAKKYIMQPEFSGFLVPGFCGVSAENQHC